LTTKSNSHLALEVAGEPGVKDAEQVRAYVKSARAAAVGDAGRS